MLSIMNMNKLLIIDGITIPKIKDYSITHSKLWANADRNMYGDLNADLIGLFPKIDVTLSVCTIEEIKIITGLLDKKSFVVEFYDDTKDKMLKGLYYSNDYKTSILSKERGLYNPLNFALIPYKKKGN